MRRRHSRCRWPTRRADAALVAAACLALTLHASAARAASGRAVDLPDASARVQGSADDGGETLYLQVTLNQTDTGRLLPFVLAQGRLGARASTLRGLGLRLDGARIDTARLTPPLIVPLAADTAGERDDVIPLDSIDGLAVRYDAALQTVALDAPLAILDLDVTRLNSRKEEPTSVASSSPGLLLNYDLYTSRSKAAEDNSLATELRAFGLGNGVLENTAITRSRRVDDARRINRTVRLETRFDWTLPDSAITASVGDTISGSLGWTRGVRMGGVQIGRDFSLQPYRVTTPLPAFLGDAALPSSVELYVNGIRQYRGDVPAGPFQLATVPGITGAGNAQVVVTDAFGRTRSLDFPFYSTQQVLARGVSDWSVNLGQVREDYGVRSFSYANDVVGSASLRRGVTDGFTLETHGEAGGGLMQGGAGALWVLGRAGVVNVSYAGSRRDGRRGQQRGFGYSWSNGRFNVSLDSLRSRGDYADVASLSGAAPPEISERAFAGAKLPRLGSVSLSYVRLRYGRDAFDGMFDSRYAGALWSRSYASRWSANVSINQNLDDSKDRLVYAGVSVSLDPRRQMSTSYQRTAGRDFGAVEVSQSVPGDGEAGGVGWRVQAQTGDDGDGGLAQLGWASRTGRYAVGIASVGGAEYGFGSASGSLVLMGGRVFASRDIPDAFAVVSTDGIAGVPVLLENRPLGVTDAHGMLLVTPLNAWQRNRLAIDPMQLGADLRIDRVDADVVPRDRSGTRVHFAIQRVRAAVVVLQDARGAALPVGSQVAVADDRGTFAATARAEVGYDGETYLENLGDRVRLRVTGPGLSCEASFDYPADAGPVPRVAPVSCAQGGVP